MSIKIEKTITSSQTVIDTVTVFTKTPDGQKKRKQIEHISHIANEGISKTTQEQATSKYQESSSSQPPAKKMCPQNNNSYKNSESSCINNIYASLKSKRFLEARNTAEEAYKQYPESVSLKCLFARTLRRREELEKAQTLLREIIKQDPNHYEALLECAMIDRDTDQCASALEKVQYVISKNKNHFFALTIKCSILLKQNAFEQAKNVANEMISMDAKYATNYLLRAEAYIGLQQLTKAKVDLDYVQDSHSQLTLFFRAKIHAIEKRFAEGLSCINRFIEKEKVPNPSTFKSKRVKYYDAVRIKSNLLFQRAESTGKEYHTAARSLSELVKEGCQTIDDEYSLAKCKFELRDYSAAIELLEKIVKQNPEFAKESRLLGWCHYHQGHKTLAQRIFNRCIAEGKSDVKTILASAEIHREEGEWPDATRKLKMILQSEPQNVAALDQLIFVTLKMKNFAEVLTLLTKLEELDPNHPCMHLYKGETSLGLYELDASNKQLLENAEIFFLKTPIRQLTGYLGLAKIYFFQNRLNEAIKELERYFNHAKNPEVQNVSKEERHIYYNEALTNLGKISFLNKNYHKAAEAYEKLTRVYQDSSFFTYECAFSAFEIKNYHLALSQIEKLIKDPRESDRGNALILRGMIHIQKSETIEHGIADFEAAFKINNKSHELLIRAKQVIEIACKETQNSELLYLRALVLSSNKEFDAMGSFIQQYMKCVVPATASEKQKSRVDKLVECNAEFHSFRRLYAEALIDYQYLINRHSENEHFLYAAANAAFSVNPQNQIHQDLTLEYLNRIFKLKNVVSFILGNSYSLRQRIYVCRGDFVKANQDYEMALKYLSLCQK